MSFRHNNCIKVKVCRAEKAAPVGAEGCERCKHANDKAEMKINPNKVRIRQAFHQGCHATGKIRSNMASNTFLASARPEKKKIQNHQFSSHSMFVLCLR